MKKINVIRIVEMSGKEHARFFNASITKAGYACAGGDKYHFQSGRYPAYHYNPKSAGLRMYRSWLIEDNEENRLKYNPKEAPGSALLRKRQLATGDLNLLALTPTL